MRLVSLLCVIVAMCLIGEPAFAQGSEQETSEEGESEGTFSKVKSWFTPGTEAEVTSGQDAPDINEIQSEAYDGPKARLAVSRFTDKTRKGWYTGSIGDGMADQLATALFNSNRFILLERQALGDVLAEQDLASAGRVSQQTAAPTGQIEGAEILVTGAVTEFDPGASGGGGSTSGLFGLNVGTVLGAVSGGYKRAHLAIDVRLIDTRTSRILAATSVEGEATDVDMGGALLGATGGSALSGSLGGWENTPIEKALRIAINLAVEFVVSKTPPVYYRFGPTTQVSAAPAAGQQTAAATATTQQAAAAPTPTYEPGSFLRVKSKSLNARSGPGKSHGVLFSIAQGQPVQVLAQDGSWVQVFTQAKETGWVAGWLVYPDASIDSGSFAVLTSPEPQPAAQSAPAPSTSTSETSATSATTGAAGAAGAEDLESRLTRLKSLYDKGLITEDEYNLKRQEILENL
jgi:curli biogenesis system outer membrane secretion channel CsgG